MNNESEQAVMANRKPSNVSKKKALAAGGKEAAIEVAKMLPGAGAFIESVRKYHDEIEEQQREAFTQCLVERIERLEENQEWYKTDEGERFFNKIIGTALNAEYADKLEYLANALVNGPSLGDDDAKRMKFLEMVRQLSKPALDVLVTSMQRPTDSKQISSRDIASVMEWHPALVDACVQELYAAGAYSYVTEWHDNRPANYFQKGTPALTPITAELANFVQ